MKFRGQEKILFFLRLGLRINKELKKRRM